MRRILAILLALFLALSAGAAWATFHTFVIEQIYSNADGSVHATYSWRRLKRHPRA